MTYKLFIDECLSPELAELAREAGHLESSCSRNLGMLGMPDWQLITRVVEGDYTLVTNNARDFRGDGPELPGGLHAGQEIHAGLVCLHSCFAMDLGRQRALFGLALEQLSELDDLVNQCMELYEHEDGSVTMDLYEIPRPH